MKVRDLTGQTFSRLTVLKRSASTPKGRAMWECVCECGNLKKINSGSLVRGATRSCGCLQKEINRACVLELVERSKKLETCFNRIFYQYGYRAKKMGREFSLTREQVETLISAVCFYCDAFPSNFERAQGGATLYYNGIDRVNADKGYTLKNCVTCCHTCNFMKRRLTAGQFIRHVHKIAAKHSLN